METQSITIESDQVRKLLSAGSPEAALLYIYRSAGNPQEKAGEELPLSATQMAFAEALLRQLGLCVPPKPTFVAGERPAYGEADVLMAMNLDGDFKALYGDIQRQMGRVLNTEELKILLGFSRYLGLPNEVVSVLVNYCRERSRQRGSSRSPSLRTIEKEAYFWAEQGIDTLEEAAAFIRARQLRTTRLEQLKSLLQIRGRNLTPGEVRYAESWLEMGFDQGALAEAYDRTCLNTGGLNWAYMNRILTRWHQAGLHTLEAVKNGDRKSVPQGASGQLGQAELEAIQRMLQEV